jgi:hypothetical protein
MDAPAREPANAKGPIFIVSPMGSGSTLLRLMLDSHPNIAIPHETGFMRIYAAMRSTPFKLSGRGWARRLGWSDEELDEEARRYFDRMFMRYAEAHGKARWGEKTPQHTWHMGRMRRVFPDSVYVAIVRHPGDAAASNMRRFGHNVNWATVHARRYLREIARQSERFPHRMVLLRYEDLVQQPERLMRELLDWLGEPWSDDVLRHHEVQRQREHERVEGLTRADHAIDPTRIARWTEGMSKADARVIRQRLRRIGAFFGYSFEDPTALEQLSERGLLFGGDEVGPRVERFADLDLRTRGEVPLAERIYYPGDVVLAENPYGGLRFKPGERDRAVPEPGRARVLLSRAGRKLPRPLRRRARRLARRAGLKPPEVKPPPLRPEQPDV